MLPIFAPDDFGNVRLVNAKLYRERRLRYSASCVACSNSGNIALSQLCVGKLRTVFMPAFCNHISRVLGVGSKKQMTRIYARRVVTAMKNVLARWNRSKRGLPREAVCVLPQLSDHQNAISCGGFRPKPKNAPGWSLFAETRLKSLQGCQRASPAFLRAEPPTIRGRDEHSLTYNTRDCVRHPKTYV
jgi:hypothetical protein